jgi:hypothetical protein
MSIVVRYDYFRMPGLNFFAMECPDMTNELHSLGDMQDIFSFECPNSTSDPLLSFMCTDPLLGPVSLFEPTDEHLVPSHAQTSEFTFLCEDVCSSAKCLVELKYARNSRVGRELSSLERQPLPPNANIHVQDRYCYCKQYSMFEKCKNCIRKTGGTCKFKNFRLFC